MENEHSKATVDIAIGHNEIHIEGSEKFISDELSTILDRIDIGDQVSNSDHDSASSQSTLSTIAQEADDDDTIQEDAELLSESQTGLSTVAQKINVSEESLAEHFYLDDGEIHILNPMSIEPKYALLGYCTIKEVLFEESYHDNTQTKKKLIDKEKVKIDSWGSNFLHTLRRAGYIKDDPNSTKSRNKPFKITPSGHEQLVNWLNEDD